ncbi:HSP20 family protein [Pustulibacterium marinum]|uniref:HSP20 family protein n=1 Tax=Pustulibacterium marinum TaxID=1224947 RepID=A0A1I7FLH8_9FLAO|nr:Hsp20/alpha crystallin family protein [Pustulibacterium marinum]SFU37062.1 HSP20 family protein [Pustulibacterium marinum]
MSLVKRNNRENNVWLPNLLDEFFKPDFLGGVQNLSASTPAVNIRDNEKEFVLELAVPGRKRDDFNLEVDEGVLTISSENKTENEVKEQNYTRREFNYTSFKRAFTLPESVNEDAINANYEDGVLSIALPKKEEALPKPKRTIQIG